MEIQEPARQWAPRIPKMRRNSQCSDCTVPIPIDPLRTCLIIDRITISVEESQNHLIYVQRQENKKSTLPYKGSPLHRIYVPVQLQPSISLCVVCNCFDQNMKNRIAGSQGLITYRLARSHAEPCQQPSFFLQFFSLWRPVVQRNDKYQQIALQ